MAGFPASGKRMFVEPIYRALPWQIGRGPGVMFRHRGAVESMHGPR